MRREKREQGREKREELGEVRSDRGRGPGYALAHVRFTLPSISERERKSEETSGTF